jgi:hypothetical protein
MTTSTPASSARSPGDREEAAGAVQAPRWHPDPPRWSTRAGLDSGTATKGSELKFTQPGEFIDLLRGTHEGARARRARAAGLTGRSPSRSRRAPRRGSWVGENPAPTSPIRTCCWRSSPCRQDVPGVDVVQPAAARLGALRSVDAEQMVREDLAMIHALAWDLAAIAGTGAANQPRGIINTAGIGSSRSAPTAARRRTKRSSTSRRPRRRRERRRRDDGRTSPTPVMRGKLKNTPQLASARRVTPIWGQGR